MEKIRKILLLSRVVDITDRTRTLFMSLFAEVRQPWINAVTAANWIVVGISAHESALMNVTEIVIPGFED